jgi:3-methylcrotonyl-CoA carboxylase beta subunit
MGKRSLRSISAARGAISASANRAPRRAARLELADLAGAGLHDGVPPGAGMVTGIGQISGRLCMVIANDATVKGGTYFGITCRKHVRAQQIAREHRLPCVTLVDSGGAFLPDQARIFPDEGQFGSIFHQQVGMSAEGIAQIAVVMGACTAGGAYIPALCDEVVIVRGQGFMYLGGPQLTQAATGEQVDAETLGGAAMHSRVSGVTDHLAEDDAHALAITRTLVAQLGEVPPRRWTPRPPRAPTLDPAHLHGFISRDARHPSNNREVVLRLVDDSRFDAFKPLYGDTLMCGFARINGFQVGILANLGVLFTESALKATHFIDLCCKRDIPLVFLADVAGFMVGARGRAAGHRQGGCQVHHCDVVGGGAALHDHHGWRLRCRLPRDVRARVPAQRDVHVAERARGDHGARAGRDHTGTGSGTGARARRPALER